MSAHPIDQGDAAARQFRLRGLALVTFGALLGWVAARWHSAPTSAGIVPPGEDKRGVSHYDSSSPLPAQSQDDLRSERSRISPETEPPGALDLTVNPALLGLDLNNPLPDVSKLPTLAGGVPNGVLGVYHAVAGAAAKLQSAVESGTASEMTQRNFAKFTAIASLISANRYWYVGPMSLMPRVPRSTANTIYYRVPFGPDNDIAVFEVSAAEFPDAVPLTTLPEARGVDASSHLDRMQRVREKGLR